MHNVGKVWYIYIWTVRRYFQIKFKAVLLKHFFDMKAWRCGSGVDLLQVYHNLTLFSIKFESPKLFDLLVCVQFYKKNKNKLWSLFITLYIAFRCQNENGGPFIAHFLFTQMHSNIPNRRLNVSFLDYFHYIKYTYLLYTYF